MTVSPAIGSLFTPHAAAPARAQPRRSDGFDRQLHGVTADRLAQSAAGAATSAGGLLASDLLRQLQTLSGLAQATPPA